MTGTDKTAETQDKMDTQPEQPDKYIGNILLPLIILGLAGLCFYQSLDFPGGGEDVGPAGVPYLWIGFTSFFCVILLLQAVLHKVKPDPIPGNILFVFMYACGLALYLLAIENIGYYISTLVFLITSMYVLGYRKYYIMIGISVGWLVFAYVVFAKLLYIQLPQGPLMSILVG